jgi:Transposase DDE domain
MAATPTKQPEIREQDVRGLKYFDRLAPLLQRLHDVGCQRDSAHNRSLHFDNYCMLVLLFLFNPIVTSLRGLQQASELKNVQKKLGCPRTSLGSLSEAAGVFDPERLKEIIAELGGQLEPLGRDARLKDIRHTVTLVDATLLAALPRMAEASLLKSQQGSGLVKWRLHTHFEVDRHVPARIDVTREGGGDCDERAVLERTIEPDRLYVMDRGYAKFTLFNRVVAAGSSYVCRLRDNSVYTVVGQRPLSDDDRTERVTQDAIITLGDGAKNGARPDHPIRLITIACKPHRKQGRSQRYARKGSTGPPSDGVLRLATNRLDVPAEIIALLYHYRWTIEIFFRFFKQILGCRHLLSRSRNGIEIQTYCAIIACMLISLWTGKKPTLRTYEMICWYLIGMADMEELLAHLDRLKKRAA